MRQLRSLYFLLAILPLAGFGQADQPSGEFGRGICTTMEMDSLLRTTNPSIGSLSDFEQQFQNDIADYKIGLSNGRIAAEILTIPVIVHVLHSGQEIGEGPNISAEQINSQIDAFNEHFRRRRSGFNSHPDGADIEIEFAPALWDPQGNRLPEPGIDRVETAKESWDQIAIQIAKPETIWNPNQYFNIWTVKFGDKSAGLLGYAQFPSGSGLDGLGENEGSPHTDGVVMNYLAYGTIGTSFPYDEGKVVSHEVGHWLGLRHIWGDGGCGVDDYCDDTPNASQPGWSKAFLGCPTDNECGAGLRPVENYMDYSDDPCKNTFTNDQKDRMRTVMEVSPRRKELKSSTVHLDRDVPYARFTSDVTSACERAVIKFEDKSSNNPTSWNWSFYDDDGNMIGESTDQNPELEFSTLGSYDVKLIVGNDNGNDELRHNNYISIVSRLFIGGIKEDFENTETALEHWLFYNPDDDRTFDFADKSAYDIGEHSIFFDNYSREDDPSGKMDALVSPKMDFSSSQNPYLLFDHAYAMFDRWGDTLAIYYSTDCAETFELLWSKGGSELATADPREIPFRPNAQQWDSTQISLEALVGFTEVHLLIANISGAGNNLYLDNLQLFEFGGRQLPQPVTIRASDTIICVNELVRFEDMSPEYPTGWNWTFEGGTPATSTVQNPVVKYSTAGKYDVTLQVTNSVGNVVDVFSEYITVGAKPQVNITSDQVSYCPAEEVTLTGSGAVEYFWFDERDVNPISEDTFYVARLFTDRTFHLLGFNEAGCADTTSYRVDITTGARVSIQASDTIVCARDTVQFTATGGDSYIWFYDKDTFSTESSISIPFYESGIVGVEGKVSGECSGFDVSEITVLSTPDAEITVEDNILTSSEANSYQWYLDGDEIADATSRIYVAEGSGEYYVVVFNTEGCSDASESVSIDIITGLEDSFLLASIQSYPNPTNGRFILELSGPAKGQFYFQMTDITGKIIKEGAFEKHADLHKMELHFESNQGVYLLKVNNGENYEILKIVKN